MHFPAGEQYVGPRQPWQLKNMHEPPVSALNSALRVWSMLAELLAEEFVLGSSAVTLTQTPEAFLQRPFLHLHAPKSSLVHSSPGPRQGTVFEHDCSLLSMSQPGGTSGSRKHTPPLLQYPGKHMHSRVAEQ